MMLYKFLLAHREELIKRCRAKVIERQAPRPTEPELSHGIPLFLDQLTTILQAEQVHGEAAPNASVASGEHGVPVPASAIDDTAVSHGNDLLRQGFTVDQVVHDYGDLCQAITALAVEQNEPIAAEDFRTLNMCLDNAIARSVTEYGRQRDQLIAAQGTAAANERLGLLAHELRNLLGTAMLAVTMVKSGSVGLGGATGAVLDRSLLGLRNLIDRSLAEVRLTAALPANLSRISVSQFIEDLQVAAALEAQVKGVTLTVWPIAPELWVDADAHMLLSAVSNLLQNAFKFTRPHGHVVLSVRVTADRVCIEVADQCGGLPPGKAEELFQPFAQRSANRTGLGLGLSISRRGVEACGGTLQVRNLPGTGCVFTVELPLQPPLPPPRTAK